MSWLYYPLTNKPLTLCLDVAVKQKKKNGQALWRKDESKPRGSLGLHRLDKLSTYTNLMIGVVYSGLVLRLDTVRGKQNFLRQWRES